MRITPVLTKINSSNAWSYKISARIHLITTISQCIFPVIKRERMKKLNKILLVVVLKLLIRVRIELVNSNISYNSVIHSRRINNSRSKEIINKIKLEVSNHLRKVAAKYPRLN